MAPEFGEHTMVATPLGALLDWTMGTPAGFAAYRDPRVNAMLKKILSAWCDYLSSADSLYVLNDSPSGWKSEAARRAVGIEQYEHDPHDEHWGFASWNDFFTRHFADGERPVAVPDDELHRGLKCARFFGEGQMRSGQAIKLMGWQLQCLRNCRVDVFRNSTFC